MINLSNNKDYNEKKFYVLFNTPRKGIYVAWSTVAPMINGVKGVIHKSYSTLEAAKKALAEFEQNQNLRPPTPIVQTERKNQTRQEFEKEVRTIPTFTQEVRMQVLQTFRSWKDGDQHTKGFYLNTV